MANPNALVDLVRNLSQPVEAMPAAPLGPRYMRVGFQGGQAGLLDMSIPRSAVWSEVLDSLCQANVPAYVEIDPATNVITNGPAPLIVRVGKITSTEGDAVEFELVISHVRHYLRRMNPDFDSLLHTLQPARDQGMLVVVTETPVEHEIIDVRLLPNPPMAEAILAPPPATEGPSPAAVVTPAQAQQMFNLVNSKICSPATAAAPCVPFSYPDDGCWGRAHEMCRLMIASGIQPDKVWIYGSLRAATQNNPRCEVQWGWHLAPTLSVNTGAGLQAWVIDPSLFPGPVPQATWASTQGDPQPTLIPSPASIFYRNQSGSVSETDPTYTCNGVIGDFPKNDGWLTRCNTVQILDVSVAASTNFPEKAHRWESLSLVGLDLAKGGFPAK